MIRALGTLLVTLIACMSCAEKAHDTSVSAQATPSETSEVQPPLTQGEQKLIRSQIAKNWVIDIGMEGLEEMAADIVVEMNPNGTVQSAELSLRPRWPSELEVFRPELRARSAEEQPVADASEQAL